MIDTPQHIKSLQLKIWLSKAPMERLKQMMEDNESLFNFWENAKRIESPKVNEDDINANTESSSKM